MSEDLEISPTLRKLFRGLEIFFWILSTVLAVTACVFIVYQLVVLFVPFWIFAVTKKPEARFPFPDYFYRVYGDDVETLTYEHYGYLLSAIVVTTAASYHLIPNHPWIAKSERQKTD